MRFLVLFLFLAAAMWAGGARANSEVEERSAISAAARTALLRQDFSTLETMSRTYRARKLRTASGLWKLTVFYAGLSDAMRALRRSPDVDAAFAGLNAKIAAWIRQYPKSPSAHIAFSLALREQAWAHRGSGYAGTVKDEAWPVFYKYIGLARQNLEAHKALAAADPDWYVEMLHIAKVQSWDRHEFEQLFDEAVSREPLYYQAYFEALEYLLPKWHGDARNVETFARNAAERTARVEGKGMYARIYWYASQTQFGDDLFVDSTARWPRMKAGFDDVVAKYPDPWNLNHFAKFACLSGDKAKTRALLKRIAAVPVPDAWSPDLFGQCMQWASGSD